MRMASPLIAVAVLAGTVAGQTESVIETDGRVTTIATTGEMITVSDASTHDGVTTRGFSSVGPFTGQYSDSFETQCPFPFCDPVFFPCLPNGVFGGIGDLCVPGTSNGHLTPGWSFDCFLDQRSGEILYGSAGGTSEFTFPNGVADFGGYFATNAPNQTTAFFSFYDVNDDLIASDAVRWEQGCEWTWGGWSSPTNIHRITVTGDAFSGFVMIDDIECNVKSSGCDVDLNGDTVLDIF
ncbi:MAG: hypothetical protein KDA28_16415, partial [Phycisphaerales bacterium]|nr:hypothetical protein [Phycisphaerales bacterium]